VLLLNGPVKAGLLHNREIKMRHDHRVGGAAAVVVAHEAAGGGGWKRFDAEKVFVVLQLLEGFLQCRRGWACFGALLALGAVGCLLGADDERREDLGGELKLRRKDFVLGFSFQNLQSIRRTGGHGAEVEAGHGAFQSR